MRRFRFAALVLLALATVLVARARMEARAHALGGALGGAVLALSAVGVDARALPPGAPDEPDVVSGSEPASTVADGVLCAAGNGAKGGGHRRRRAARSGILVPASTVLRLARRGIVPEGRPVAASGMRPAGVELHGVSSLGTGVEDGDVLTEVAGTKVHSEGQVVGAIVGLRAARAPSISGTFYRGSVPFTVTVEMPYPPGAP